MDADVLWKKIIVMFEHKNDVNRVSVFRKIVSMEENLSAYQLLINQNTSLEVPLNDKVLTLLLLGSLPDLGIRSLSRWATSDRKGKHLSLEKVKLSLINEEACWKDTKSVTDLKASVMEGDMNYGRGRERSPQNRDRYRPRSKSKGRPMCFYCGKQGTSRSLRIVVTTGKTKGELRMFSRRRLRTTRTPQQSPQARRS